MNTTKLYNNEVCYNVPISFKNTAIHIKNWAIENNYPIRVYFFNNKIDTIYIGKTQQSDGYTPDIYAKLYIPYKVIKYDNQLKDIKNLITEYFIQHPINKDDNKFTKYLIKIRKWLNNICKYKYNKDTL